MNSPATNNRSIPRYFTRMLLVTWQQSKPGIIHLFIWNVLIFHLEFLNPIINLSIVRGHAREHVSYESPVLHTMRNKINSNVHFTTSQFQIYVNMLWACPYALFILHCESNRSLPYTEPSLAKYGICSRCLLSLFSDFYIIIYPAKGIAVLYITFYPDALLESTVKEKVPKGKKHTIQTQTAEGFGRGLDREGTVVCYPLCFQ